MANEISPTEWRWKQENDRLIPIMIQNNAAPEQGSVGLLSTSLLGPTYPLFIDYSMVSFILYFTKSTLITVLNNHDNTHACINYIKRDGKLQN